MAEKTETALCPGRKPAWDHFVHGADIGVEGRGPTRASSFKQAALALTAWLGCTKRSELRGDLRCHTVATDGHGTVEEMARAALEQGQARCGWLEARDVLNTRPLDELLLLLRKSM